jgi:hypothetical protein
MFKQALVCAALATVVAIGTPNARPADHSRTPSVVELADAQHTATVMPVLLRDIVTWLSLNFDLPATERLPNIAFTSPARMTALRYRGLLSHHDQRDAGSDIVAVYDSATETIHLPDGWRGAMPAELSVLVHEVVHHLQHRARLPYACPEEREKLAYQAQDRWLHRFERTLFSEFGTDGFTLLVRTNCGF